MAVINIPEGAVEWKGFWAFPWNLPEKRPGAYRFTNLVNGKPYIGIGEILHKRCRAHSVGHSPRKLKNAVNKYSKGAFLVEPIFYSISGTDCLHEIEAALIVDHDAIRNGYNIIEAGGRIGPYGEAFSEALRAAKGTPEARAKMRRAARLTWDSWSDEEKARLYEGRDAYLARPEVSAAQSEKMKAIWADPEQRASRTANSKAAKAAMSDDAKLLAVAKLRETLNTPEVLARRAELTREKWKDPAYRAAIKAGWARARKEARWQDPQFDLPFYPAADSEP